MNDSPAQPPAAQPPAEQRLCARVSCGAAAAHTMTADYSERIMAVGPLSPVRTPPAHDLCQRHSDALTPPAGWELLRHEPERSSP